MSTETNEPTRSVMGEGAHPVSGQRTVAHAVIVVFAYTLVFGWLYAKPVLDGSFLAESDLYEYYLPIFLSPITTWSHFEFGGLPAFADPGDFTAYPLHFLFARLFGPTPLSWTALSVSAYVLASCFAYAYVLLLTGSRRAAAFSGLAFGLSEAMLERLPHSGTLHAAAWLPLILLSIERVREARWRPWVAVGSVAVACCLLAGHPQPSIYIYYCCAAYALVAGRARREPLAYYLRVSVIFVLGGVLTFIKTLPFAEASFYMARQEVNFGQFTGHANSPAQMLSMFFPTIVHEGREAPTYVGLITFALACAAIRQFWRTSWRVPFWTAVIVFALLLGAGDSTPVATIAYYLPLYGKFRASARHLFLAAFGLCVLSGFAVAAIESGAATRRSIRLGAGMLLGAVVMGAAIMLLAPQSFALEERPPLPWILPLWNSGIWVQLALAAMTIGFVLASLRLGRTRAWVVGAMALLFVDTLYSLPYRITTEGLVPITIASSATQPSVHATRIAASLAPLHQRALAPSGTHVDAVLPAAWARKWSIPIAGGYGPMLLGRYSSLAQMGTNGSVDPSVLSSHDLSLDLLAVRRVIVKAEDLTDPETFEREGLIWSQPPLDITVGRADCNYAYERTLALTLPREVELSEVALVAHLRCSEGFPAGTAAAQIELRRESTVAFETPLHVGTDIADRALAEESVLRRAGHKPAHVFDDPELTPYTYLVRIRPPEPVAVSHLVVRVPPNTGWLAIDRLTIVDRAGRSIPLSSRDLYLHDRSRWVESDRFETSRTSDRGADESSANETGYLVLENRRALPRAWVVSEARPLDEADLIEAIRHGQLPDGQVFDPRTTALVDRDAFTEPQRFPPGHSTANVQSIRDGRIVVDVTSPGGFLVLSETFYPGWRARTGDASTPVIRTNLGLQGIALPPGTHTVEFEFAPLTLRIGSAMSALGVIACLVLIGPWQRRRGHGRRQT